jgi:hypothetical protein
MENEAFRHPFCYMAISHPFLFHGFLCHASYFFRLSHWAGSSHGPLLLRLPLSLQLQGEGTGVYSIGAGQNGHPRRGFPTKNNK